SGGGGGGGGSGGSVPRNYSPTGRSRAAAAAPPPPQQHQQQDSDGGVGGAAATAGVAPAPPMASSFIDLGGGRAAAAAASREGGVVGGSSNGGGGGGGGRGYAREGEGTEAVRQRRLRHLRRRSRSSEGVSAVPAAAPAAGGGGSAISMPGGGETDGDSMDDSWETLPSHAWWRDFVRGGEEHVLVWERGPLTELHAAMRDLAWKKASRRAVNEALKRSALAPVVAAAALPLALLEAASGLDDPWGVVRSRALEAGRLLAAVLLSRPVGSRPVTLLGYSMGAKVAA
ncbi:unnamed protein product, partial [Hapterophycus canaliculatus]